MTLKSTPKTLQIVESAIEIKLNTRGINLTWIFLVSGKSTKAMNISNTTKVSLKVSFKNLFEGGEDILWNEALLWYETVY